MPYLGRVPLDLQLQITAGTLSWDRLPLSDRLYYESGAKGGTLVDDDAESAAVSACEGVYVHEAAWERAAGAYCDALDLDRKRLGLTALSGDVDREEAPVGPAVQPPVEMGVPAPAVGVLAVSRA